MTEYNAPNHDYSVMAGVSGAMFWAAASCFAAIRSTADLPAGVLGGDAAQLGSLTERPVMNATTRPSSPPFGRIAKLPSGRDALPEQGKGPAVVLIHGSGPRQRLQQLQAQHRPHRRGGLPGPRSDMIGFGWSSKPDIITRSTSRDDAAEFLDGWA
jgi:pimeloyl-ACP methyl ester carboxylesterase